MLDTLGNLAKAVVGVVVETPVAIVKDIAEAVGIAEDKGVNHTGKALDGVMENVEKATS